MTTDKLNRIDYRWFIVRTLPRQELLLANMLVRQQEVTKNILEVYCPTHTTVKMRRDGKEEQARLFTGFVFVLATRQVISDFLERSFPDGVMLYDYSKKTKGRKTPLLTIPEEQMRMFRDFNENYADQMVILERPYSDYAFNPKTNEPNEIVRVIDGPLAGREGYIARFRRDKRLVFKMRGFDKNNYITVALPNVWNFHVVRLHNAEGDRQTVGTMKERAVDFLIGLLQSCGYVDNPLPMLYEITDYLSATSTFVGLCQHLFKKGHHELSKRIAHIGAREVELILNLVRYEKDNPGYIKTTWTKFVIRPFLTPTSGIEIPENKDEVELQHSRFTEIICKVGITEEAYYPSKEETTTITTTYYAHIGIASSPTGEVGGGFVLFANWDTFLGEYFLTAGKANEKLVKGTVQTPDSLEDIDKNEKLVDSFRNYAPTLYKVLTDTTSKVKAVQGLHIGEDSLNAFVITSTDIEQAKTELTDTCIAICKEINSTTHLSVWRRYLRSVWLHE